MKIEIIARLQDRMVFVACVLSPCHRDGELVGCWGFFFNVHKPAEVNSYVVE